MDGCPCFATVLNLFDPVQEFSDGSKKLGTALKVFDRIQKAKGRSKKFPGGSGKFGAVEKDSGPSQKVLDRSRPDFSLQKHPEAPDQRGGGPILSAGAQEEDERCGGFAVHFPRAEDLHHLGREILSSRTAAAGSKAEEASPLRRMSAARRIHQVRAGKANHEALYAKGPQPAAAKREDDR